MKFTDKEKDALKVMLLMDLIKVDPVTGICDITEEGKLLLKDMETLGITTDSLKKERDRLKKIYEKRKEELK